MKIFVAADHQGFQLKENVVGYLREQGYEVEDVGNTEYDAGDDFALFAQAAARRVLETPAEEEPRGILLCGGGQGMAMAANRFKGIRAAVIWDPFEAKMTRNDNDANMISLPARILQDDESKWKEIIDTWLTSPFAGEERYVRRNQELDQV